MVTDRLESDELHLLQTRDHLESRLVEIFGQVCDTRKGSMR